MSAIQPANQPPQSPQKITVTSEHAPCPSCRASMAAKVGFTWWGGVIGPRLLHVVRCLQCNTQYNGKTGGTLTKGIVIYTCVAIAIAVVLMIAVTSVR